MLEAIVVGGAGARGKSADRYRRLPRGTHGLQRAEVELDQRRRLRMALLELIAERGYPAVRVQDVSRLARVSRPTFYDLYDGKDALLLEVYDEFGARIDRLIRRAFSSRAPLLARMQTATRGLTRLAAAEPEAMSLLTLGAFGAGEQAMRHRSRRLEHVEHDIDAGRRSGRAPAPGDYTVKAIIGGIREAFAARLGDGRAHELPALADQFAAWACCYPVALPAGLEHPPAGRRGRRTRPSRTRTPRSQRASRSARRRLPSGRHDLRRPLVVKDQRERIIDAVATIVADGGLAALTVPEITRRANVSNQTFYELYASKHDALLGAQKIGSHLALRVTASAFDAERGDWPHAAAAGLRALLAYLASEPAHADLSLVSALAWGPETVAVRDGTLREFRAFLVPGMERAEQSPAPIVAELTAGGLWQILQYYVAGARTAELVDATPQIVYLALTPFLGPERARAVALE
jgi:AcrR family transcriptional regulator